MKNYNTSLKRKVTDYINNNIGMLSLTNLAKKFKVTPAAVKYQLEKIKNLLRVQIGSKKIKYFINKVTNRVLGQIRYYVRRLKFKNLPVAYSRRDYFAGVT